MISALSAELQGRGAALCTQHDTELFRAKGKLPPRVVSSLTRSPRYLEADASGSQIKVQVSDVELLLAYFCLAPREKINTSRLHGRQESRDSSEESRINLRIIPPTADAVRRELYQRSNKIIWPGVTHRSHSKTLYQFERGKKHYSCLCDLCQTIRLQVRMLSRARVTNNWHAASLCVESPATPFDTSGQLRTLDGRTDRQQPERWT